MKRFALAAMTAALMSSGAYAADVYSKGSLKDTEVVTEAARSWTGLWLGAFGGIGFAKGDTTFDHLHDGELKSRDYADLAADNGFGQVQVGYDRDWGRIVTGLYGGASIAFGDKKDIPDGYDGMSGEEKESYFGGARVGYKLNKDTLLYLGAGIIQTTYDFDFSIDGDRSGSSVDFVGAFGELGLETRISGNLYGRVAGRYSRFGDETIWTNKEDGRDCWDEINVDPSKLEVMAGITYKFGTGERGFFGD